MEPCRARQFAFGLIFVTGRAYNWKESIEVGGRSLPGFAVRRNEEFGIRRFRVESASDEDVRTPNRPDYRAGLAFFRDETLAPGGDVLDDLRSLAPSFPGKVRMIFPKTVADRGRIGGSGSGNSVIFDWVELSPIPNQCLV